MNTATRRQTIGFDRKIQLEWLDATADWTAEGLSVSEIRSHLANLLAEKVSGEGPHSARGKTITVLLHIWSLVPDQLAPLRDDAFRLLQRRSGRDRLPLHWGMCVATYPFFRDVATTTGRLLTLQDKAALSQITRRTAESWGERSTVARAAQRVVRSLVEWDVLRETEERGVFAAAPRIETATGDEIAAWLIEAAMSNSERRARPLNSLLRSSAFFPFVLHISPRQLADSPRLEVHRQGVDEDVVVLRTESTISLARLGRRGQGPNEDHRN